MNTGHAHPTTGSTRRLTRDDVLSAAQVADILGFAPNTVYALARKGEIPGTRRLGRQWVFSAAALRDWLDGNG